MIISGGLNVYSLEVELLDQMQGVVESAVIGTPHDRWGEAVTAFVITTPGSPITTADVLADCRDRVATFKAPQTVTVVADERSPDEVKSGRAGRSRGQDELLGGRPASEAPCPLQPPDLVKPLAARTAAPGRIGPGPSALRSEPERPLQCE